MQHKQRRAGGASDREAWPQCPSRNNCVVSKLLFPGSLLSRPADSLEGSESGSHWGGSSESVRSQEKMVSPLRVQPRRVQW